MATVACAVLLVVLVALASIDLRLDIAADSALIEQVAGGGEPRRTAEIASALHEHRSSEVERRLLALAGGGLLLLLRRRAALVHPLREGLAGRAGAAELGIEQQRQHWRHDRDAGREQRRGAGGL